MGKLKVLLGLFVSMSCFANPPIVWGPNQTAQMLTGGVSFTPLSSTNFIMSGANDPTVVATNAPKGSLYASTNGFLYVKQDAGSTTNWGLLSSAAVLTMGALDGQSANSKGATIATNNLYLQSASGTQPGLVNTATQTLAGNKTFSGTISASNLSGANSGDLTLAAVGASPNANAGSLTGQALTLQPANGSFPGVLLAADWTTFNNKQASGNYITALTSDVTATGPGSVASTVAKIQGTTVSGTTGTTNVVFSSGPTLTNPIVGTQASSDNSTKAASTAYVQTALAQLNPAQAVYAASTANIAGTYTNAVGGVCIGDTFTTTATSTFALDGTSPALGARVLFKDQSSSFQDGVWTLTTQAVPAVSGAILTRALDFDSSADINAGSIVPITNGTVNAGASWYQTATVTTCNSDSQTWTQFQKASSAYLLAANNLSDVGTKATAFNNISPMTTGGDLIYGGASGVGTRLANGSNGQVLTSSGGTSAPTWTTAGAGTVTSVAATVPSVFSISGSPITTSGTLAMTYSGTALPTANGGTGQTSLNSTVFTTLFETIATTGGDLIYGAASGAPTRLANGSNQQVLTSSGGTAAPTWAIGKPAGEVFMTAATSCPTGSMAADGSSLTRSGGVQCGGGPCANLFTAISTTYGSVDGSHFTLPNLQGVFVRGANSQTISSISYSGTQGTTQGDQFQGHFHGPSTLLRDSTARHPTDDGGTYALGTGAGNTTGPVTDGTNGTPRTGTETRPANIVLLYCIVY